MQNLIPPGKRNFPSDSLDGTNSKRQLTLYPASKVPGAGFKETLDASFFDPADTANTPGMGPNSSTDLQDQEVNIKIAVENCEFPPGNDFVSKLPQGCAIFIRAPLDRTERDQAQVEANGVINYSDRLLCVTPEQLRYQLHRTALDNVGRKTCLPIPLHEVLAQWKFFGICDEKPIKAKYASSAFSVKQSELQWLKTLHRSTQAKMINYWKRFGVDGQKRSYIWWKAQEVDIAKETAYTLGTERDGSPIYYLNDQLLDLEAAKKEAREAWANTLDKGGMTEEDAINLMTTVRYVPAIVPWATQSRAFTDADLSYEVTLPSGKKQTRKGNLIFVGRVTRRSLDKGENPSDYDYVSDKDFNSYKSTKDACTNMQHSGAHAKLDLILHATSKIYG